MDMTMSSSIRPNRVEVVTSVQRRRRWTTEQKLEIVKQTNEPGSSVSLSALVSLLFTSCVPALTAWSLSDATKLREL